MGGRSLWPIGAPAISQVVQKCLAAVVTSGQPMRWKTAKRFFLSGMSLQRLVREVPDVAFALIEGLIGKGKCYSALIQMLGTRSVSERLRQLLVILANTYGRHEGAHYVIDRSLTYEQIATIVGATRQWVTQSLEKMQNEGVLKVSRKEIVILSIERLEA